MNPSDLTERYTKQLKGVLHCFDRLVLLGTYKAIGWPRAMGRHLQKHGVRLLDYEKTYANGLRLEVAQRVKAVPVAAGVAVIQVNFGQRKEALVGQLLARRGRREGIVCILGAMERCRCYKVGKNHDTGLLQLQWSPGKCQHFYVYFIDVRFGLGYLRIPTWAPFRLQAYCNGHDWLERRMKQTGIGFRKADNCFTHLSDFAAAQALVAQFDVLRIECTTSDITSFTYYRKVEPRRSRDREAPAGNPAESKQAPMRKTLYSLPALAEAMQACNQR